MAEAAKQRSTQEIQSASTIDPRPVVETEPPRYRVLGEGQLKYGGVRYNRGDELEIDSECAGILLASGSVEKVE